MDDLDDLLDSPVKKVSNKLGMLNLKQSEPE